MKICNLIIENFMAIGSANINLADRGLVLIQGENADESSSLSNGAGKSSIADALCWVLYGETARGESGDDIVNTVAKKDCRVCVTVRDGDTSYVIARYRKHKTGKNTLTVSEIKEGAATVDLTKGTVPLTQPVVEQIIGCSYEVFKGAIYAGQGKMPDLPGMTDKQLKMLIEEASGATLLESAYKEASTRLVSKKEALEIVNREREAGVVRLVGINNTLKTLEATIKDHDDTAKAAVIRHTERAKGLVAANNELLKVLSGSSTPERLNELIKACDAKIAAVAGEQETLSKLTQEAHAISTALAGAEAKLNSAREALSAAQKACADIDHKLGCPCDTCARPFSEADLKPAKKLAMEKIRVRDGEVSCAQDDVDELLARYKTRSSEREAFLRSMTDLSATNAERASLIVKRDEVEELWNKANRTREEARKELLRAKEIRDEPNPHLGLKTKFEGDRDTTIKAIAVLERKVEEATAEVKIATAVQKVFSPAGVRAFLLDEVTPYLNEQTAKYLGTLSDGHITATWTTLVKTAKGELREKFSIEVENATGGSKFGLISGGEQRKVRIACALALQDLVARRASKPIELFIGDEIDDALDSAGLERLTTVLEEKARERGSVFIISHNDLKDWVRNSIVVKKSGGKATIEELVS